MPVSHRLLVSVVDDDESVRESLPDLLRELGYRVAAFSSAADFLASTEIDHTSCLILDIAMPGMSGPELMHELVRRQHAFPLIFMTAHGSAAERPRLVQQGAVDCLAKPFSEVELLRALNVALPPP